MKNIGIKVNFSLFLNLPSIFFAIFTSVLFLLNLYLLNKFEVIGLQFDIKICSWSKKKNLITYMKKRKIQWVHNWNVRVYTLKHYKRNPCVYTKLRKILGRESPKNSALACLCKPVGSFWTELFIGERHLVVISLPLISRRKDLEERWWLCGAG